MATQDIVKDKLCRWCRLPIPTEASICHYCSHSQNYFHRYLEAIGLGITFLAFVLSLVSFGIAQNKLNQAELALKESNDLAVITAKLHIENVLKRGYSRIETVEELKEEKNRVEEMLLKTKIDPKIIKDIVAPFDKAILKKSE